MSAFACGHARNSRSFNVENKLFLLDIWRLADDFFMTILQRSAENKDGSYERTAPIEIISFQQHR